MGARKIILLLLLAASADLTGCRGKEPAHRGSGPVQAPAVVERIVSVENRANASGTSELLVPEASVFHRGALAGVWVVGSDGSVTIRWINPGRTENGYLVILGGLDAGERIVGKSGIELDEGMAVKEQVSEIKEVQSHE